jgi:hypothetical protein
MIDIGKNKLFTFSKLFENLQFFRICILRLQKVLLQYDPKKFFLEKYQNGYKKMLNFYADFSNSLMPAFRNAPNKS